MTFRTLAWAVSLSCSLLLAAGCSVDPPTAVPPEGSSSTSTTSGPGPMPSTTSGVQTGGQTTEIADDTGTSGTTGPAPGNGCCEVHPEPTCDDPDITTCVCRQEAFCCAFAWDETCVEVAEQDCGGCGPGTSTTDPSTTTTTDPGTGGDDACCTPAGTPGCPADPAIEMCVCALDPFCCDEQWDSQCVDEAQADCGAMCMGGGGGGGDCCAANGSPGCDDMGVEACVCGLDPYCCSTDWDDICVAEAEYECMGGCGLPPANMGDCCSDQPGPGCDDMMVTQCVCMIDNDCCLFPWGNSCIQTAVNSCGSMCPGFQPQDPCCQPQNGPGCGDMMIENCVCAFDPFCCSNTWDGQCVGEAQMDCMLDCSVPGMGDCCAANGSPGCEIPEVQDCVCMADPFCCNVEWDGMCVDQANVGCGGCMGPPGGSSSGSGSGSGSTT